MFYRCLLSPFESKYLKVVARAIKTTKEEQVDKNLKGRSQMSRFTDDMIVYINDPKNSITKLRQLINTFSNVPGYKINSKKKKPVALLYTNDKWVEKEIRKKHHHSQ